MTWMILTLEITRGYTLMTINSRNIFVQKQGLTLNTTIFVSESSELNKRGKRSMNRFMGVIIRLYRDKHRSKRKHLQWCLNRWNNNSKFRKRAQGTKNLYNLRISLRRVYLALRMIWAVETKRIAIVFFRRRVWKTWLTKPIKIRGKVVIGI